MKLVVDSGSTKTDWFYASSPTEYTVIKTKGINPVVQTCEEIKEIISGMCLRNINDFNKVGEVYFYGAGCTPLNKLVVESILKENFLDAEVNVESDLLAAARALCGRKEGLAAILGTGANSCFYDGRKIVANTPALGFILGDEGSGAVLGRKFLNGIIKGWLPSHICENFYDETGLTVDDIIDNVYRKPSPNRFLASMSEFILRHVDSSPELESLVVENFDNFISINLNPYRRLFDSTDHGNHSVKIINAVGSVAYYYKEQLAKAAHNNGYKVGKVVRSPVAGLLDFHFQ